MRTSTTWPRVAGQTAALDQREQDADDRVRAGQRVAETEIRAHRRLAREAVHIAQPADRLAHRGEPGASGIRTVLAVAGDARVDQPRIDLAHGVGSEPPFLHGAGPEVLDDHVGLLDQATRDVATLFLAQIHTDTFLVARQRAPPQRGAVAQGAPLAQRVASRGRFELDDLGTEVAEHAAGKRAGDELAEFDDTDAVQRAAARR